MQPQVVVRVIAGLAERGLRLRAAAGGDADVAPSAARFDVVPSSLTAIQRFRPR